MSVGSRALSLSGQRPRFADNDCRVLSIKERGAKAVMELLGNEAQGNIDEFVIDGDRSRAEYTLLHAASHVGRTDAVRWLLEKGASVDKTSETGCVTPLRIALEYGHTTVVELLLKFGADPNRACPMDSWAPPLHVAAERGLVEISEVLIEVAGVPVDLEEPSTRKTPLHCACEAGNQELATKLLKKHCAKDNATDTLGWTILHSASAGGCEQVVQVLLQDKPEIDLDAVTFNDETPLMLACLNRHEGVANLLIDAGAALKKTLDPMDVRLLHYSARAGLAGLFRRLLDVEAAAEAALDIGQINEEIRRAYLLQQAVADGQRETLLHSAAQGGSAEIVRLLLNAGLPVDVAGSPRNGETALHRACRFSQSIVAELLLDSGADITKECGTGETPLQCAAWAGCADTVRLLLPRMDENSRVAEANRLLSSTLFPSPGHVAVSLGVSRALVDAGARLDVVDKGGRTLLHQAVQLCSTSDTIKFLLGENGAAVAAWVDPTTLDFDNQETALHLALRRGYASCARELLMSRANDNGRLQQIANGAGKRAIHVAAEIGVGLSDIIKIIIERGTSPDDEDRNGKVPVHYTRNVETVRLFVEILGASINTTDREGNNIVRLVHDSWLVVDSNDLLQLLRMGADPTHPDTLAYFVGRRPTYHRHIPPAASGMSLVGTHREILELLVDYGAAAEGKTVNNDEAAEQVEEVTGRGHVLLMAIAENDQTAVEFILETGCCRIDETNDNLIELSLAHGHVDGKCTKIIVRHIALLLHLRHTVLQTIRDSIANNEELASYSDVCTAELQRMFGEVMGLPPRILSPGIGSASLANHARNQTLLHQTRSHQFALDCPNYAEAVRRKVQWGALRGQLMEAAEIFFVNLHVATGIADLPRLPVACHQHIFEYLSNRDIRALNTVCYGGQARTIDIQQVGM